MTQTTRSGRVPTKKVPWEEREILPVIAATKKSEKSHVQVLETRAASLNAPPVIHELASEPHAPFTPPIRVANEPFQVRIEARDPLSLFMCFLSGFEALSVVCAATNADAEKSRAAAKSNQTPRPWETLRPIELLHWLGGLFYMANHTEHNRKAYWESSEPGNTHQVSRIMTETRWDQIHRFLTFNPQPRTPNESPFSRFEPIASAIRRNCQNAVKAST
jgi:hypothetical protein